MEHLNCAVEFTAELHTHFQQLFRYLLRNNISTKAINIYLGLQRCNPETKNILPLIGIRYI